MNATTHTRATSPLRLARLALGVRQRDLAEMIGVPPQRVSDWETGLRIPTADQLRRVWSALAGAHREVPVGPLGESPGLDPTGEERREATATP